MQAIWKRFWSTESKRDKGTLYQLKNEIYRTSVPSDPKTNMNAAEDFLCLILHAHTVAAAKSILKYVPVSSVNDLADKILVNFIHLSPPPVSTPSEPILDGVQFYAVDLLTLSLIWHGFHDSIKEGDGDRIIRYWKLLLIIFKASDKRNYGKEAVILLLQYYCTFSEREKTQLLWSRCVNTKGSKGGNIPCDLHMEHLNRRLKIMLRNVTITPKIVEKAGKCLFTVDRICKQFEQETASRKSLGSHAIPVFGKDFDTILKVLEEEEIFTTLKKRDHGTFKFTKHLMETFTETELLKKIRNNIDNIFLV